MTRLTQRRRTKRPRYWCVGLGSLALVIGWCAKAEVQPQSEQQLPAPGAEKNSPTPSATGTPEQTPFGASPDVFPALAPPQQNGAAPENQNFPFGPAPDVFPGLSPSQPTSETPTNPAGVAPTGIPATSATTPSASTPAPETTVAPQGNPNFVLPAAPELSPVPPPAPVVTPQYGFGNLVPIVLPPQPVLPPAPVAPNIVGLAPIRPGALPIQAAYTRAPPILVAPQVLLSEGYTDNPRGTPNTLSDSVTHLNAATAVSVDTVHLQGQINGNIDYRKYARASDEDQLNPNLVAFGLGTVVRDHVFIDGRATITQLSRTGGVAFTSPGLIPPSQQTQTTVFSVTPIVRESLGSDVDAELRYNFGMNLFQNGSLLKNSSSPGTPSTSASLSNATRNDATLSVATGRSFTTLGSKLTLDATKVDSQSAARSTQLRGFDDAEYRFTRQFAALVRLGYEKLNFPLQPQASTTGPMWLIGGEWTPFPASYAFLRYGREDGFYGFDGLLRYQITAATALLASVQHNLTSTQDEILNNLNTSQEDIYGNLISSTTGLPSALTNPEFSLLNNIFRQQQIRVGGQTNIGRDAYALFAFLDHRSALGPITAVGAPSGSSSGSDTARGVNLSWTRAINLQLSSAASIGYSSTVASHQKTLTANWVLTYTLNPKLNAVLQYQFINVDSQTASNKFTRNQIEVGLRRSF